MTNLSIIVAASENNAIGLNNKMPWEKIPQDLKRFKELTLDHGVIMGRKTYQSILDALGKPLPNRYTIVLSRDKDFTDERVEVARSLPEATLRALTHNSEVFVAGGADVYAQALPQATKLYFTKVKGEYQGDAFFPEINLAEWQETWSENHEKFSFINYNRK